MIARTASMTYWGQALLGLQGLGGWSSLKASQRGGFLGMSRSVWLLAPAVALSLTGCGNADNAPRGSLPLANDVPRFVTGGLIQVNGNNRDIRTISAVDDGPERLVYALKALVTPLILTLILSPVCCPFARRQTLSRPMIVMKIMTIMSLSR